MWPQPVSAPSWGNPKWVTWNYWREDATYPPLRWLEQDIQPTESRGAAFLAQKPFRIIHLPKNWDFL